MLHNDSKIDELDYEELVLEKLIDQNNTWIYFNLDVSEINIGDLSPSNRQRPTSSIDNLILDENDAIKLRRKVTDEDRDEFSHFKNMFQHKQ